MFNGLTALALGYIFGSFPSAYLAGRLAKGIDIREIGTSNMGAMNVIYEVGVLWGILVLLLDALKGIGAILLARSMGTSQLTQLASGFVAVVGHTFPVFLKFRGGKGGATALGLLLFLMPGGIPYYLAVFIVAVLLTRNLTFAYSTAFVFFPFAGWLIYHSAGLIVFSLVMLLWVIASNIPGLRKIKREGFRRSILRRSLKERRI